ncbi:MAG: hypothetical protein JWN48_5733 [Myxococcaceae bacterium]|nr:hypothetical protein [Myxococcaceae bacterium]
MASHLAGPELTPEQIDWSVHEEHLEEAEFLLRAFDGALESPVRTLAQLASHPEQLLAAHADALVVAGPALRKQMLLALLAEVDPARPYRVAAAALVEVLAERCESWSALLEQPASELRVALRMAARLGGNAAFDAWLRDQLISGNVPNARATLLDLVAARGLTPPPLFECLQDNDTAIVAAAARVARYGDASTYLPLLDWLLRHESAVVRAAALPAALAWGSERAWAECERSALSASDAGALSLYAALGGAREHAQIAELLGDDSQRARALFALGHSGDASLVPRLLTFLESSRPHEAKLAAQAISMITGIDLLDDSLARPERSPPPAEPFQDEESVHSLPPFEDDDLNADLEPPPEEELPVPRAEGIERLCASRHLEPGKRLLEGLAYTPEQVLFCLEHSALRRRHIYAEAFAIRTGGKVWLDTRTSSRAQLAQLAQARGLAPRLTRFVAIPW